MSRDKYGSENAPAIFRNVEQQYGRARNVKNDEENAVFEKNLKIGDVSRSAPLFYEELYIRGRYEGICVCVCRFVIVSKTNRRTDVSRRLVTFRYFRFARLCSDSI